MNFTWQKRKNRKVKHETHMSTRLLHSTERVLFVILHFLWFYCEFQKYEVMTISVVGGQLKT